MLLQTAHRVLSFRARYGRQFVRYCLAGLSLCAITAGTASASEPPPVTESLFFKADLDLISDLKLLASGDVVFTTSANDFQSKGVVHVVDRDGKQRLKEEFASQFLIRPSIALLSDGGFVATSNKGKVYPYDKDLKPLAPFTILEPGTRHLFGYGANVLPDGTLFFEVDVYLSPRTRRLIRTDIAGNVLSDTTFAHNAYVYHHMLRIADDRYAAISYLDNYQTIAQLTVLDDNFKEISSQTYQGGKQCVLFPWPQMAVFGMHCGDLPIYGFDKDGRVEFSWSAEIGAPTLATPADGGLIVGGFESGSIYRYDKSGQVIAKAQLGRNLGSTLRILPNQNILVSVFDKDNVNMTQSLVLLDPKFNVLKRQIVGVYVLPRNLKQKEEKPKSFLTNWQDLIVFNDSSDSNGPRVFVFDQDLNTVFVGEHRPHFQLGEPVALDANTLLVPGNYYHHNDDSNSGQKATIFKYTLMQGVVK